MSRSIDLRSALVGGLIAGLVMSAMPVVAGVGDTAIVGQQNRSASRATTFQGLGGKGVLRARATRDTPALDLQVNGDAAPMTVNSAGLVENLNVDLVDGVDANGLVRVAFARSGELPDGDDTDTFTAGFGTLLSTSITAPTAGWLVITGTVDAFNTTSNNTYGCHIILNGMEVLGTFMTSQVNGATGTNESEDCSTHGIAEIPAGTHSVHLDAATVATTTDFADGSLSVLFVPFDGDGAPSDL